MSNATQSSFSTPNASNQEDSYRIRVFDPLNWVVEKFEPARKVISGKYKGKIAEPRWVVVGYFPTPAQALRFAYQHGIRDLANGDVPDLLAAVEASEDRVRRISHKIL